MATIKIKRNKSDASAKPTSLQEGELAANLLDRSLFTNNGSAVVKLYTGEDKYFSEDGFANKALDATKLGGQLPSYYATATALEALREEIGGGADTSNLATKEELAECEEVTAAALNELNDRVNELSENVSGTTVTKEEFAEAVDTINTTILENEEISAAALTDLASKIEAMQFRLQALETVITNLNI